MGFFFLSCSLSLSSYPFCCSSRHSLYFLSLIFLLFNHALLVLLYFSCHFSYLFTLFVSRSSLCLLFLLFCPFFNTFLSFFLIVLSLDISSLSFVIYLFLSLLLLLLLLALPTPEGVSQGYALKPCTSAGSSLQARTGMADILGPNMSSILSLSLFFFCWRKRGASPPRGAQLRAPLVPRSVPQTTMCHQSRTVAPYPGP